MRLGVMVFALLFAGCGTNRAAESVEPVISPSFLATPTAEPTASPTPDVGAQYRTTVCDVIDPLVIAIGEQMAPALDAVFEGDLQATARERARLDVIIDDLFAALDAGEDYAPAGAMERRLVASIEAFNSGLDAASEGRYEEAAGLFEVGSDLFAEAKDEFARVC